MPNVTEIVAWWGAIVATLVLLWDVVKWLKEGPRLRLDIKSDVYYPDSEVLSTTKLEGGGTSSELAGYHHIEIANVGDMPTTLISLDATHSLPSRDKAQMHMGIAGFKFHHGAALPHKLSPGESVSARLDMRIVAQLAARGKPILLVRVSHAKKPLKKLMPRPLHAA